MKFKNNENGVILKRPVSSWTINLVIDKQNYKKDYKLDDIGPVNLTFLCSEIGKEIEKRTREVLDLLNESLGALIFDRDSNDTIDRKCKLCSGGELSLKNSFRGGALLVVQTIQNVNLLDLYLKLRLQRNIILQNQN